VGKVSDAIGDRPGTLVALVGLQIFGFTVGLAYGHSSLVSTAFGAVLAFAISYGLWQRKRAAAVVLGVLSLLGLVGAVLVVILALADSVSTSYTAWMIYDMAYCFATLVLLVQPATRNYFEWDRTEQIRATPG
jgi:hypothetical protein